MNRVNVVIFTGTLEAFEDRNGNRPARFRVRQVGTKRGGGEYHNPVQFATFHESVAGAAAAAEGCAVLVYARISGREYEGKYYSEPLADALVVESQQEQKASSVQLDDIPF